MPETREIPRAGWNDFFSAFTREHETQLVAVEVIGSDIGAQVEGRSLLLGGISAADDQDSAVALMFDSVDGEHLTHMVSTPTHVWVQLLPDQTDAALEIESADGTKTLVRFPRRESRASGDTFKGAERFPRKGDEPW